MKAWLARDSYKHNAQLTTFLYRITRNAIIDFHRYRSVRPVMTSLHGVVEDQFGYTFHVEHELDRERIATLIRARASLSFNEMDMRVYQLFYEDGESICDIARMLNAPHSTVRVKAFRIREKLKQYIKEQRLCLDHS